MKPAHSGAASLVPPIEYVFPLSAIRNDWMSAIMATSGMLRMVVDPPLAVMLSFC